MAAWDSFSLDRAALMLDRAAVLVALVAFSLDRAVPMLDKVAPIRAAALVALSLDSAVISSWIFFSDSF